MKTVQIQASRFFELLKNHDQSMWSLFAQMIDGEEKELVFLGDESEQLFSYKLPSTLEQLEEDQKLFAKEYSEKLKNQN